MNIRNVTVCGLVFAGLAVGSPARASYISNGSFESGLTGWSTTGVVGSLPIHYNGVTPTDGARMAVLSPLLGALDSSLSQSFTFAPGVTAIRIKFDYNIQGLAAFHFGQDFLRVTAGSTELLRVEYDDLVGGGASTLGWATYDQTFATAGLSNPVVLKFNLENFPGGGGDIGQATSVYIDNVSAGAVPVPPAALLFGLGAAGLGYYRRRLGLATA